MRRIDDLSLHGVTLRAGRITVLDNVTFQTPLSGITLLSGRNGIGKTTFLHALLGLWRLESGHIAFSGLAPRDVRQGIGYMPQTTADAASMLPAASHVAAAVDGARWGIPLRFRARAEETRRVLALTGATEFADRPLGALSGGEAKRVGLSQALVGAPRLLLLDEPLAGLDHQAQRDIVGLLADLARDHGVGVVLTSHETASLDPAVTRVLEIGEGQIHARL